ncbi:unnamed protein product [Symbiodinium natans]|uniref:Uncharacterized protein n=1 Tax=Symbiodinium natans TaxID=878477 RepID=A0A812KVA5_9DINO|nr:unnamed protein product [Symbiodinium natans]
MESLFRNAMKKPGVFKCLELRAPSTRVSSSFSGLHSRPDILWRARRSSSRAHLQSTRTSTPMGTFACQYSTMLGARP